MKKSAERTARQRKENRQTVFVLFAVIAFVIAAVCAFLGFYTSYNDKTLYAERLNQMQEVTTQLFSGLEDVVKNEWQSVTEKQHYLQQAHPTTLDGLFSFMDNQSQMGELDATQCNLVAVDENGWYYTQAGRQGLLTEREYLISDPEQISFVSNAMTNNETRMVFLKRLDQPITLQDSTGTVTLQYYGIAQNMEALNPYFECKAYDGKNSVYVIDDTGLKLFSSSSSSSGDLLKGYNVFTALSNMQYLHGSDFADTMQRLESNKIAYSNAVLNGTEIYYALYKMDNSAWTLIFLVPSEYVAMNTVKLVNTTMRLVMTFAVLLVLVCGAAIFWLSRRQQKAAVAEERRNTEKLAAVNEKLAAAVKTAEQAEKAANEANKAKSDFLSNMSHDIRTPMNAIVGITKLMEHEQNDPEKMSLYLHKVQSSSNHLLGLINDVLDMSKIESSEVKLNHEPITLADQVGQVDSIIRPQTEDRNQEFTIHVHEIVHEYLIGDAVRMRQVFINLLSNAVKYTPNGGRIQFDIGELPSPDKDHAFFSITVTDNGYGMSPDFAEHIFEPFTRAENSMTNKVQGTGLGMAITKNIVDLMGGTISVESEMNKGSCFHVTMPMRIDKNAMREVDAKNVLLITDEKMMADNARASFQETDVDFRVAETRAETEKALAEQKPDTILLSGMLHNPHLTDIVQDLHRKASDALLVFCVDYGEQEQVSDLLTKSNVNGLITRPFFFSNFARVVNQARSDETATSEEDGSVIKGLRFLCAEDNALNAEILEALLDMAGATCKIYPDGQQLVEAFADVKPGDYDAILMDVQMPVMNGLDATRAIRRSENPLGKTMPILAMTANAFSSDVQACLDAGMDAHVSKPIDMDALERTLRTVLNRNAGGGKKK